MMSLDLQHSQFKQNIYYSLHDRLEMKTYDSKNKTIKRIWRDECYYDFEY